MVLIAKSNSISGLLASCGGVVAGFLILAVALLQAA